MPGRSSVRLLLLLECPDKLQASEFYFAPFFFPLPSSLFILALCYCLLRCETAGRWDSAVEGM